MNFNHKVYNLCRKIPHGKITTYKEIATALDTKAYRAVGQALRNNPDAPRTPCHRVVSSSGKLHGFKGKTRGRALKEKQRMLEREGLKVEQGKVNLSLYLHTF